jgi:hypothetical protein
MPKGSNSRGSRRFFGTGQRLGHPSGSHPKALEGPATPVDASVILQGLQQPVVAASDVGPSLEEPTVSSSTIRLPPKGARLQEPIVASSAIIAPPSERARPQESIISSSAVVTPPPK